MTASDDTGFEQGQLHFAAADGDLDRVKALVAEGQDVNRFDADTSLTPLHHAVRGEHFAVASFLLQNGADINAHDEANIGETPLAHVAATCSLEMAQLLVDAGADPTIPGWMQLTALDRAQRRKSDEGRAVHDLLQRTARQRFNFTP